MLSEAARRFAALPTPVKLLLILSAALLPVGIGLVWAASQGIRDANNVLRAQAEEQARLAARGVESLIARNALALRIAANGRIARSGKSRKRDRFRWWRPATSPFECFRTKTLWASGSESRADLQRALS